MTVEQLQYGQSLVGNIVHHKTSLQELEDLREEGDTKRILQFFAGHGYYSESAAKMAIAMLDEEIEGCHRVITKLEQELKEL